MDSKANCGVGSKSKTSLCCYVLIRFILLMLLQCVKLSELCVSVKCVELIQFTCKVFGQSKKCNFFPTGSRHHVFANRFSCFTHSLCVVFLLAYLPLWVYLSHTPWLTTWPWFCGCKSVTLHPSAECVSVQLNRSILNESRKSSASTRGSTQFSYYYSADPLTVVCEHHAVHSVNNVNICSLKQFNLHTLKFK